MFARSARSASSDRSASSGLRLSSSAWHTRLAVRTLTFGDRCAPSVQHRGDLFYRLVDGDLAEHFPGDRAAVTLPSKCSSVNPNK